MNPDTLEFLDGYDRWYKNLPSPGGAAEIEKLKGGKMKNEIKEIYYNWSEGGGALIKPVEDGFELYEVAQYGGIPQFMKLCKTLKEAKSIADIWT